MRKRDIPSEAIDPEIARLDTTDGCGADDENARLLRLLARAAREHPRDQRDYFDLRISQALQRAAVDASATDRIDDNVNVRALGDPRFARLLGTPVELMNVMAINYGSYRTGRPAV